MDNLESFETAREWLEMLQKKLRPDIPKVLVGTKSDLPEYAIDFLQIYRLSKKFKVDYLKVSAMTGEKVEDTFV